MLLKINHGRRSMNRTRAHQVFAHLESCFWDKPTEMVYQHCTIRDSYDMENQKRFAEEKESLMGWTGNIFSPEPNTMREPSFQWADRWGGWFICMVHHLAICPLTTNRIVFHISCRPPSSSGNLIIFVEFVDGSFILEKLEVWVMKQKLHAKNIHAHQYAHL